LILSLIDVVSQRDADTSTFSLERAVAYRNFPAD
jgi:hypothetical protein